MGESQTDDTHHRAPASSRSAALLARDPLCAEYRRQGLVTPATQRDHVVALEDGGLDDASNEQGLCDDCHANKAKAEAARDRWSLRRQGEG